MSAGRIGAATTTTPPRSRTRRWIARRRRTRRGRGGGGAQTLGGLPPLTAGGCDRQPGAPFSSRCPRPRRPHLGALRRSRRVVRLLATRRRLRRTPRRRGPDERRGGTARLPRPAVFAVGRRVFVAHARRVVARRRCRRGRERTLEDESSLAGPPVVLLGIRPTRPPRRTANRSTMGAASRAAAALSPSPQPPLSSPRARGAPSFALGVDTPSMAATSGDGVAPPRWNAASTSLTSPRSRYICAAKILSTRAPSPCSAILVRLVREDEGREKLRLALVPISTALGTTWTV